MMSRRRQSRYNCRRGGAPSSSMAGGGLPANAIEWVRSIGLGQYAERMRHAGLVRLELAARIGEAECARLQMTPAHKTKLLASARRLGERLQQRAAQCPARTAAAAAARGRRCTRRPPRSIRRRDGRMLRRGGDDGHGGCAEGGGASGGGQGAERRAGWSGIGRARPAGRPALQRRRNEASKARIANHSRKQGAASRRGAAGSCRGPPHDVARQRLSEHSQGPNRPGFEALCVGSKGLLFADREQKRTKESYTYPNAAPSGASSFGTIALLRTHVAFLY